MIRKKKLILISLSVVLFLLFCYLFFINRVKIEKIAIPFFIALVISYIIKPLIKKLEQRKIPCTISILLIYSLFFIVFLSIIIFIMPELINSTRELMNTLPQISFKYQVFFNNIISFIQVSKWPPDIKNTIYREINNAVSIAENNIIMILKKSAISFLKILTIFFDVLLAMIIAYYFIKDGAFFKDLSLNFIPKKWRNGAISCGRDINTVLENFVQGQLLTALIIGSIETIGLFIINVKYPLVLGLVGGIANVIPYFGPIIGAIPAVAVAMIDSPIKAGWVILVFIIVQQIDNAFISPNIIEGKLGVHPVTTILAVLVGGEFFGIIGMLVAVPVIAIIKIIIRKAVEAIV